MLSSELQSAKDAAIRIDSEMAKLSSELSGMRRQADERGAKAASLERDLKIARALLDELRHAAREQGGVAEPGSHAARRRTGGSWRGALRRLWSAQARAKASRQWEYDLIHKSKLFDPLWYLQRYPDVAAAGDDPLWHYILHGGPGRPRPAPAVRQQMVSCRKTLISPIPK